jgi:two-component system nitrogen regulation response regulator NtrX
MWTPGAEIVGQSAAMQEIYKLIGRVAASNATVLIQGESGSGKELIARALHAYSDRWQGPFVAVNCSAIPGDLLESEMFGHERGAFTGATERHIGKFEQAAGGTLFLDEIADMPMPLQSKLLRVLQEREFERLGSTETVKVNVRLLSATNKDMERAIAAGTFREDLYYRLNVFTIFVPPLRERPEDIAPLITHFVSLLSRENNRKAAKLTPQAVEFLQRQRWKGNVRELRNAIERLLIMTADEKIDVDDVGELVRLESRGATADNGDTGSARPGTLREFKESAERAFLVQKLRENAWNISKTAEVIGTPRSNLYKKLEQYQIRQETDA